MRTPLLLLFLAACADKAGDDTATPAGVDWSTCSVLLAPSEDDQTTVQTALIEAVTGDEICLDAGTYTFQTELSLSVDGVTVRGAGADSTILDFTNQDVGGNGLAITGDDVTLVDFRMMNTPGDGIRATNVSNIAWLRVTVGWDAEASENNGAYGFYPVGCDGVRIEESLVYGARDAGLYVGQSSRILVARNEAYGNVAGIEIENSTDAEVVDNHTHDNTAGILVFSLPGLEVGDGKRAKVHGNLIENNNAPNFAVAGNMVASVPPGIGLVLLASDHNEFHDNTVTGHDSAGMLSLSYIEAIFGVQDDASYDLYPESNWVHDNSFSDNGANPQGLLAALTSDRPMPDLVWDGCTNAAVDNGDGSYTNCYSDNGSATFFNFDWCGDFANQSTDLSAYTCQGTALDPQDP